MGGWQGIEGLGRPVLEFPGRSEGRAPHLYCSSVMLGLKGRPLTERPVRILVDTMYLRRHRSVPWARGRAAYLLSGSRLVRWSVWPKSEGGWESAGPKPPW